MNQPGIRFLLPRFLTVGGLGFLLDASSFQLLFVSGAGLVASRLISASLSITLTWILNRHFVFRTVDANASGPEYARYIAVQTLGLLVNFGVYFALVANFAFFRQLPILALCWGALAALTLNFLGARFYAFNTNRPR